MHSSGCIVKCQLTKLYLTESRGDAYWSTESEPILAFRYLSPASMYSIGACAMKRWISYFARRIHWWQLRSRAMRRNALKVWISSASFSSPHRHSLSVTAASRPKNSCRWTWGSYFEHRKSLTPCCFEVILLLYADGESWVYCLNTREKSLLDSKPRRPARAVTEMSE